MNNIRDKFMESSFGNVDFTVYFKNGSSLSGVAFCTTEDLKLMRNVKVDTFEEACKTLLENPWGQNFKEASQRLDGLLRKQSVQTKRWTKEELQNIKTVIVDEDIVMDRDIASGLFDCFTFYSNDCDSKVWKAIIDVLREHIHDLKVMLYGRGNKVTIYIPKMFVTLMGMMDNIIAEVEESGEEICDGVYFCKTNSEC